MAIVPQFENIEPQERLVKSKESLETASMPLAEAALGLRRLAEPITAGDRVKAQIARAARKAGLSYTRAFDIWYRSARAIRAEELEAIRNAQVKRRPADELRAIAADFEAIAERAAKVLAVSDRASAIALRKLAQRASHLADGA